MAFITTDYFDQKSGIVLAQAGAGVAGPLNGAKMILATNAIVPSKNLAVAGVTQPAYAGYAAQVVTWTGPFRDPTGFQAMFGSQTTWNEAGAITPTTVYGYALTDAAGANLLGAELFSAPLSLTDAFSVIKVNPIVPAQVTQNGSALVGS